MEKRVEVSMNVTQHLLKIHHPIVLSEKTADSSNSRSSINRTCSTSQNHTRTIWQCPFIIIHSKSYQLFWQIFQNFISTPSINNVDKALLMTFLQHNVFSFFKHLFFTIPCTFFPSLDLFNHSEIFDMAAELQLI